MQQLDLSIKTTSREVSQEDVELLCKRLAGEGWVFAHQLREHYAYNDRNLRAIASASDGRIISGQKGYRLNDREATVEDIDRACTWLESQGRKMLDRARATRARYHRFNHETK